MVRFGRSIGAILGWANRANRGRATGATGTTCYATSVPEFAETAGFVWPGKSEGSVMPRIRLDRQAGWLRKVQN